MNIHDHNFFPDAPYLMGATVPSSNDISVFRSARSEFALNCATITNVFDTIDISGDDFDKFYGPDQ